MTSAIIHRFSGIPDVIEAFRIMSCGVVGGMCVGACGYVCIKRNISHFKNTT